MNAQPDDFEQLRKLLALKRHEIPPPRYFNEFSSKVIAGLQAPESVAPLTWLQRFGLDFDLKPAFVCVAGVVVCGLLSVGVISAMQMGDTSDLTSAENTPNVQSPLAMASAGVTRPMAGFGLIGTPAPEDVAASIAPVTQSSQSPFGQFTMSAQKASFNFGGN